MTMPKDGMGRAGRNLLLALVMIISATAAWWLARGAGGPDGGPRARRSPDLRTSNLAPGGATPRLESIPAPGDPVANVTASGMLVFEPTDMNGPPPEVTPIRGALVLAQAGVPDGPPDDDKDYPGPPVPAEASGPSAEEIGEIAAEDFQEPPIEEVR